MLTICPFVASKITKQANVQFYAQLYSGPLPRRLIAQIATATETSINKPIMVAFSAGLAVTTTPLMAALRNTPAPLLASGWDAQL